MKLLGLRTFIVVFSHAYLEYTHCDWNDRDVYRRAVDLNDIVWC